MNEIVSVNSSLNAASIADLDLSGITEFNNLPSIVSAPFALPAKVINQNCLNKILQDRQSAVVFGKPCDNALIAGVTDAIRRLDKSFYYMFDVTAGDVSRQLSKWFKLNPFGEISNQLATELKADIERDAINFISTINASSVTLRLVLDTSSGFEELLTIPSKTPHSNCDARIEEVVSELEYDRSYLFHADEDVVNQIKTYSGATTLAIDSRDVVESPSFQSWFDIFDGPGSLRDGVTEAISKGNLAQLPSVIADAISRAWRYQMELPGLARRGATPYSFLLGAPHLYFGAPEKLDYLEHQFSKSTLHAKPLIWAVEPGAKRFSVLMDSPTNYTLSRDHL
jgi:hypothetical protein